MSCIAGKRRNTLKRRGLLGLAHDTVRSTTVHGEET